MAFSLVKKTNKKKKHYLLSLMGFSLACQAGIKISLESSFAWFMCQADMSWISLQKGPEIRHPKEVRRKQPSEKKLYDFFTHLPHSHSLSLSFDKELEQSADESDFFPLINDSTTF